jgi:hypothetical protein
MPCDTRLKTGQTIKQRAEEVRKMVSRLSDGLVSGRVKVRIGPQGAVAFDGLTLEARDRVTDACAYRLLLIMGSALARAAITRAEQLAGRSINRQALGVHSHDGGRTWHEH